MIVQYMKKYKKLANQNTVHIRNPGCNFFQYIEFAKLINQHCKLDKKALSDNYK